MCNKSYHSIALISRVNSLGDREFLVYKDAAWGCYMFPNCKSKENIADDVINMRRKMGECLDIAVEFISCSLVEECEHLKYSVPSDKIKLYRHRFYLVEASVLKCVGNIVRNKMSFVWMTLDELLKDAETCKYNSDVITTVNQIFMK